MISSKRPLFKRSTVQHLLCNRKNLRKMWQQLKNLAQWNFSLVKMNCMYWFRLDFKNFCDFLWQEQKFNHRTNNKWSFWLNMTNWSTTDKKNPTQPNKLTTFSIYKHTIFKCLLHVCNFHRTWIINHIFFRPLQHTLLSFFLFGSIYPHHSQTCTLCKR